MSKDFLCKDCVHNNHGWCKAIKRNKLKEIDKCAIKDDGSKKVELRPFEELLEAPAYTEEKIVEPKEYQKIPQPRPIFIKKDDDSFEHEVLGKRQMLWTIQRQAIAIKEDDTVENKFEELCKCINSLAKHQNFSETIGNFEDILMETDVMMINDSKRLAEIL